MKYYEEVHRYVPGDYYQICDECGRKIRASYSKLRWDGLIVCPVDFEHRHPQELLHDMPTDRQSVAYPRPRPDIVYSQDTTEVPATGDYLTDQDGNFILDQDGNRIRRQGT